MLVMAMPAKAEIEAATAPCEVGDGAKRLALESEVCLGRGWSTVLYVSSKGSEGCSRIGLVRTVIGARFESLPNSSAFYEYM
jgi:hypothetical protein